MWAHHTPPEPVVLILISLQTVSLSSPLSDGVQIYASVGDSVTFPCEMKLPQSTRVTKMDGRWNWRRSADDTSLSIIRFISGMIPTFGKLDMSSRSKISTRTSSGNFSLTVKNVQRGDAGHFQCDFQFSSYSAQANLQLFVISVTSNSSRPSLQGDGVALTCNVPTGTVSWVGPGSMRGIQLANPLVLPRVGVGHAGRWTCKVALQPGNVVASHTLDVIGFSSLPDETIFLGLGSSAVLPCLLNRFPDPGSVSGGWQMGETELARLNISSSGWMWDRRWMSLLQTPLNPSMTNLSVIIKANSLSDGGDYHCQLKVQGRPISQSVRVIIIQVNSTPAADIQIGSNVSLTCTLSQNLPDIQIEWRQSNRSREALKAQMSGNVTVTVTLTKVTQKEAGEWSCQISRKATKVGEARLILNIKDFPLTVFLMENLILLIAVPASILLLILISTVSAVCLAKRLRRKRRALRRLRHPLCREHSNQLSNQPLCQANDYISTDRPLPPMPRYCPHQPRKGRRSHRSGNRQVPRAQYIA